MPSEKLIKSANIWLSWTKYVISAGLLRWMSLIHRRGLWTAKISPNVEKSKIWNMESWLVPFNTVQHSTIMWLIYMQQHALAYAAVNWHLELPLLKDRQRFDAISTSNLEVYKFQDGWILTYFILEHGESAPNDIWSMVNLEQHVFIVLFIFLFESESWSRKNKSAWWIFTQFYFRGGESWPNYFG